MTSIDIDRLGMYTYIIVSSLESACYLIFWFVQLMLVEFRSEIRSTTFVFICINIPADCFYLYKFKLLSTFPDRVRSFWLFSRG